MMDRTDRWFRRILRAVTRRTLLYTEMVVANAILHGDRDRLLGFDPLERPLALQLGGDDPAGLAECARLAFECGFDEVNLNVGCPSDRVQKGRIGACLMADPSRVAECVAAMREAVPLPVTVKHRLGIDDRDSWDELLGFVDTVAAAGCDRFSVHARKAWLSGLSPKENREIPPLRREVVHQLAAARPELIVEVNGGIRTLEEARRELEQVDAVMIGRAAVDDPWLLADADPGLFGAPAPAATPHQAIRSLLGWIDDQQSRGMPLRFVARHLHGFFAGRPGAARWRRALASIVADPQAGASAIEAALDHVGEEALLSTA